MEKEDGGDVFEDGGGGGDVGEEERKEGRGGERGEGGGEGGWRGEVLEFCDVVAHTCDLYLFVFFFMVVRKGRRENN